MKTKKIYTHFFVTIIAVLLPACLLFAGTVRYVKPAASGTGDGSSWANASADLQAMLNASTDGDSVWVAAGTYFPAALPPGTTTPTTTSRDFAFYVPAGVKLYGGFAGNELTLSARNLAANTTILDGDIGTAGNTADNCHHVLILAPTGSAINSTRVDGFTVRNGNANGSSSITVAGRNYNRTNGGGLVMFLTIRADLYYLQTKNNQCSGFGGGLYAASASQIDFSGCEFSNNTATGAGSLGGAIYCTGVNGVIRDNSFKNNLVNASVAGGSGGGLYTVSCRMEIYRNTFEGNNSSASGGGVYYNSGTINFSNNILYNNQAGTFGGGLAINTGSLTIVDTVANNTFVSNSALTTGGGGFYTAFKAHLHNNIFWNNNFNGSNSTAGADYYRSGTATNLVLAKNNLFQLAAGSYTSSGTGNYDLGTTATGNLFQQDPLFINSALPGGADDIDRTADDGLIPLSCSPAINAGNQSLLPAGIADDAIRNNRTLLGATDMGAYERSSITPDNNAAISTVQLSVTQNQSGTTYYAPDCASLVAALQSTGASPAAGSTTAKVWIEAVQPVSFVKRHYEITPAANASTSTGRVTLYFTQQEFDAYNAVNLVQLPTGPADLARVANLLIEKREGSSSDGSGQPGTYPGTVVNIDPADGDITWNSTKSRWEVSFDVTGFSGFFVKTSGVFLPVNWVSFSGELNSLHQAMLQWTVDEVRVARYEVERSADGTNFSKTGEVTSIGNGRNTYHFTDPVPVAGRVYYRIRQVDSGNRFGLSQVVTLQYITGNKVSIYPNPFTNTVTISSPVAQTLQLNDFSGRTVENIKVNEGTTNIGLDHLPAGVYFIHTANTGMIKLVKY